MAVARITDLQWRMAAGYHCHHGQGEGIIPLQRSYTMHEEKHLYKMGDDGSLYYSNCVTYIKTEGVVIMHSVSVCGSTSHGSTARKDGLSNNVCHMTAVDIQNISQEATTE